MRPIGTEQDLSSTSVEKCFFGDLAMWKSNFSLHLSIDLNFRHTSKKIKGGSPKKILEKKNVFPKKYVELRTFDGMLALYNEIYYCTCCRVTPSECSSTPSFWRNSWSPTSPTWVSSCTVQGKRVMIILPMPKSHKSWVRSQHPPTQ